jgi:hypothetical protein
MKKKTNTTTWRLCLAKIENRSNVLLIWLETMKMSISVCQNTFSFDNNIHYMEDGYQFDSVLFSNAITIKVLTFILRFTEQIKIIEFSSNQMKIDLIISISFQVNLSILSHFVEYWEYFHTIDKGWWQKYSMDSITHFYWANNNIHVKYFSKSQ